MCVLAAALVALAGCAEDGTGQTSSPVSSDSVVETSTTTEPPTFCGVAKTYATEVLDALENGDRQNAAESPFAGTAGE